MSYIFVEKLLELLEDNSAPAQAIFYTGDKYPELKNQFVVASYNNGHLYMFDLHGSNNTTYADTHHSVEEIRLDFSGNDFSAATALAQSPIGLSTIK